MTEEKLYLFWDDKHTVLTEYTSVWLLEGLVLCRQHDAHPPSSSLKLHLIGRLNPSDKIIVRRICGHRSRRRSAASESISCVSSLTEWTLTGRRCREMWSSSFCLFLGFFPPPHCLLCDICLRWPSFFDVTLMLPSWQLPSLPATVQTEQTEVRTHIRPSISHSASLCLDRDINVTTSEPQHDGSGSYFISSHWNQIMCKV